MVFDEYLEHFPHDNVERSRYAAICYMCGHYPEADHHFQIVGDDLVYVFDKGWMKQARSAVAGKAGPRPIEPPK